MDVLAECVRRNDQPDLHQSWFDRADGKLQSKELPFSTICLTVTVTCEIKYIENWKHELNF